LAVAQHNVGSIYFQGDEPAAGVKKDVYLAVEYWKMAASQNLVLSQVNLGKLFMEGYEPLVGEPSHWKLRKDFGMARRYLMAAAQNSGDLGVANDAKELLGTLDMLDNSGGGDALKVGRGEGVVFNRRDSNKDRSSCIIM
jgi:TPR repeat protein